MSELSPEPVEMPMFPLGNVLFPHGALPLHVFEVRYQQLLNRVLETDRRFGVVLITRGSEVGGGEMRADIGTIAIVEEHQRFDDGRAAVMSHGANRLEVVEWLPDDPYPRALVRELPVDDDGEQDRELLESARSSFQALVDLGQRLGRLEQAPDPDWDPDVERAIWQLAGRAPCTAHDQYTILAAPNRTARLLKIDELLRGVYSDLELIGGFDT